jgi:4-hydroxybenzoate polyprenyltransferase
MNPYLEILRLNYWYRNITVIIGVIFAVFIFRLNFDQSILIDSIIVTLLACLISAANYCLNAIIDMPFDKKHPVKKLRPLPSRRVRPREAFIAMIILLIISLSASSLVFDLETTVFLFLLFIAAIFYNVRPFRLKDLPYIDVLSESINNPIRFLIGWSIIIGQLPNVLILLFIWFSASFLMTKKRLDELNEFKQKTFRYRNVFKYYSKRSLNIAMAIYALLSLLLIAIILNIGIL